MNLFPVFICVTMTLCSFLSSAQQGSAKKYSPEELNEDLNKFQYHLETVQPSLYLYYPKDSLDLAFSEIRAFISVPRTALEFYRALRIINRYVANGHNDIYPDKDYINDLSNTLPRFPLDLYYHDEKLLVYRNLSTTEKIQVGDEITAVNGRNMNSLLSDIIFDMSTDGYNKSLPIHVATSSFRSQYALKYGTPDSYDLKLKDSTGVEYDVRVQGSLLDSIKRRRKDYFIPPNKSWYASGEPALELEFDKELGIMSVRTFSKSWMRKNRGGYKKFFAGAFKQLAEKKTKHLIIDLRDNGGGDPEPTISLFSYLFPGEFRFYDDMFSKVCRLPDPKLYVGNQFLFNLFARTLVKKRGEFYEPKYLQKCITRYDVDHIYEGNVYVLINASSFSATGEIAGILKSYDRAVFIGEETGGNPVSNTSGIMETLELPNTGIRCMLSLVTFDMAVDIENVGRGVIPDHPIQKSLDDLINQRDTEMEYAKNLARSNQD